MSLVKYSYPITTSHKLGYEKIEDFIIPEGDYRACLDAYHKVPNAPHALGVILIGLKAFPIITINQLLFMLIIKDW